MVLNKEQSLELMNMSIRNRIDKNMKSTEAYFSSTTSLETALFDFVHDLQIIYDDYIGKDQIIRSNVAPKHQELILKTIHKHEKTIAKAINAQSVTIGLQLSYNAATFPVIWDDQILSSEVSKDKLKTQLVDKKFIASLEDVMETKDGFKFRDSKSKHIIIIVGLGLVDLGLTDKEIVGTLLHEWGHCIQQMLVSINTQLYCKYKKNFIENTIQAFKDISFSNFLTNPLKTIYLFIMLLPKLIRNKIGKSKLEKYEKYRTPDEIGEEVAEWILDGVRREEIVEETKKMTDYNVKRIVRSRKVSIFGIFRIFNRIIMYFFQSISGLTWVLFMPFRHLLDYKSWTINANKQFLKQELRYEQFADYISSAYGYSAYLSSALIKLRKGTKEEGKDLKLFNFLYVVPGLNFLIALSNYLDDKNSSLLAGYPLTIERIENSYKGLEYELEHNPKLSEQDKISIRKDMDDLRIIYQAALKHNGIEGIILNLYYKITRRTIEKGGKDNSIVENVLEPILQVQKELKSDSKLALTKSELENIKLIRMKTDNNITTSSNQYLSNSSIELKDASTESLLLNIFDEVDQNERSF